MYPLFHYICSLFQCWIKLQSLEGFSSLGARSQRAVSPSLRQKLPLSSSLELLTRVLRQSGVAILGFETAFWVLLKLLLFWILWRTGIYGKKFSLYLTTSFWVLHINIESQSFSPSHISVLAHKRHSEATAWLNLEAFVYRRLAGQEAIYWIFHEMLLP